MSPFIFDADVELESVMEGHDNGLVSCLGIEGYTQIKPRGIPITPETLYILLEQRGGFIGGF